MEWPQDFLDRIIYGDCLKVLRRIPDVSIDMILTDPPYGIDYLSNMTKNHKRIPNDKLEAWIEIMPVFLTESKRILKPTGVLCAFSGGGGRKPVTAILTLKAIESFHLIQTLVWKKSIGLGWRYRPAYENILVLSKSKDKYNFYDTSRKCSNVLEFSKIVPKKGMHPTQKPVPLMEHLIKIHSLEGDIVLDPFAGSGTTALAAANLGRHYIGIEISEEYCEMAERRLAALI